MKLIEAIPTLSKPLFLALAAMLTIYPGCGEKEETAEPQTEEERLNLGPDQAATDPNVFFFEDFESSSLDVYGEYTTDSERLTITEEVANVFAGQRSMYVPTPKSKGYVGGEAKYWFLPGYGDQVYYRYYVKFDQDFEQLHHFCSLRGGRIDDQWSAYGKAGTKPSGNDRFTVTLDPFRQWGQIKPPGRLLLYVYWPDMKASNDGNYWGNHFEPEEPFIPELGKWICMEIMIKCNTLNADGPGNSDGECAYWIDGEKIGHYYGFRWRDTDEVLINSLVVGTYIADGEADHPNRTWFDNLAAGTSYIGPIAPNK
ncbi:hypothetical protein ACFLT7_02495 [candidate division KSB1 bacterium]